jgi:2,3-bisphosphoglycerate-dependent phosphoglycerate mutase
MGAERVELILVRHGVTPWNRERRFQGQTDIGLAAGGFEQAQATAQRLVAQAREQPVGAVYASDLSRAIQTAEPIASALGTTVRCDPRLRERGYGHFEGRTHDELSASGHPDFLRWRARDPDFALPGGGESLREFCARVQMALSMIGDAHPGQAVVVVTHGGVLDIAYRLATGLALSEPRRFELLNASLNRLHYEAGRFSLKGWGDVSHLPATSLDE